MMSHNRLSTVATCQRRAHHSRNDARRGIAAVEFALVLPVFFLMVFGMIEYGRMVMVQQSLTNSSREGARLAVVDGSTVDSVKDVVENYLSSAAVAVDRNNILVSPDPATTAFGDPITVSIAVPYSDVSWLPTPAFLGNTTITATSVMRREGIQ